MKVSLDVQLKGDFSLKFVIGQVSFHLSRANLKVLDVILQRRRDVKALAIPENCQGGALLVDSTRFGML